MFFLIHSSTIHRNLTTVNYLPKKIFFDILRGDSISDEECNRAVDVWKTFSCQNLISYSDVYLISDVLLFADVLKMFVVSLQNYNSDPAQYL